MSHNLNKKFANIEKSAVLKHKLSKTFEADLSLIANNKDESVKKKTSRRTEKGFLVTTVKKAAMNFLSNRHSKTDVKKLKKISLKIKEPYTAGEDSQKAGDQTFSPGSVAGKLRVESPSKVSQDKTMFSYGGLFKDAPDNRNDVVPALQKKKNSLSNKIPSQLNLPTMEKLRKDSNQIPEDSWQLDTRRSQLEYLERGSKGYTPVL